MNSLAASVQDPVVLVALIIIVATAIMMRRGQTLVQKYLGDTPPALRYIPTYRSLTREIGRAVESGRMLHFSVGSGNIAEQHSAVSHAALGVLKHLSAEGCVNGVPIMVTAGDGTLLPAAQDQVRRTYEAARRSKAYKPAQLQFLADRNYPFTYAAITADITQNKGLASNIFMGHFGSELAFLTEAADRTQRKQIVGTDDPAAMAIGFAATDELLLGEDMLVSHIYLQEKGDGRYHLQIQDGLRVLVIGAVLLSSLLQFFG